MLENFWTFRYVFIVGPLIAATCSLLSVYIVLRRMAMISEGVSHAGVGGIAVALLVGYFFPALDSSFWHQIITGFFCLSTALLIGYFSRAQKVSEDSAIGIFLVASVALGILLLSVRSHLPSHGRPTPVSLEQLLFGNLTSVNSTDAWLALGTFVAVFGLVAYFYFEFLYVTLDEEMARINGVPARLINTLMYVMISAVIVVAVRMVGFLMITALTIIPGATAAMLSRRFAWVLNLSVGIGVLSVTGSLALAVNPPLYYYPPGPILVLTLFGVFLSVWAFRHLRPTKLAVVPQEALEGQEE